MWTWTTYDMPPKECSHVICDGEYCILNPIPMRAIMEWKFVSCLAIPVLGGFKRIKTERKSRKTGKIEAKVHYTKNVTRDQVVKFKNLDEIYTFLLQHDLKLTIDLFSFSYKIDYEKTLDKKRWLAKLLIEDFSNGQEVLQIPVVNIVDKTVPELEEYIMSCIFEDKDRRLYKRTNVCCDCTDNCRDKLKCACFQETLKCYNPDEREALKKDENIGYTHKLLPFNRQNMSGIYECNSKCQCNHHCNNRVVQYPPKWKFQIFMEEATKEKGWSVRTLNDIPAGSFVATYTGAMCQETKADLESQNENWKTDGKWKYIVNLMVMQNADKESVKIVVPPPKPEKLKPKPKPAVITFATLDISKCYSIPDETLQKLPNLTHPNQALIDKKNDEVFANNVAKWDIFKEILHEKEERQRLPKVEPVPEVKILPVEKIPEPKSSENQFVIYNSKSPNQTTYKIPSKCFQSPAKKKRLTKRKPPKTTPQSNIRKEEMEVRVNLVEIAVQYEKYKVKKSKDSSSSLKENNENTPVSKTKTKVKPAETAMSSNSAQSKKGKKRFGPPLSSLDSPVKAKQQKLTLPLSPVKSNNSSPRKLPFASPTKASTSQAQAAKIKGKYSLRTMEGKNYTFKQYDDILKLTKKGAKCVSKIKTSKDVHLIDGRTKGNIGRFFNHCCEPNLFCQYVFVNTHDVRFPVVGFFAKRDIKAGQELTWSYNYDDDLDLGIPPVMCLCKAKKCRGVLIC